MSLEIKISKGYIYNKHSVCLKVLENPTNNSIKCKCFVCGAEESYKVSDMKENKIITCKTCANGVKIGNEVNNTFVVERLAYRRKDTFTELDANANVPKVLYADIRCKKCNKLYVKTTADIKDNKVLKCRCSAGEINRVTAIKPEKEVKEKKISTNKNISGYVHSMEDNRKGFIEYEKRGDFLKTDTTSRVSATGQSVTRIILGTCIHCAGISEIKEKDWNSGNCKCKKCEVLGDNNKNIVKNINWVGHTIRNLKITKTTTGSDGVIKAEVKCLLCDATYTFNLVSVLNENELLCMACADTKILLNCTECGYPSIKTTQRALYRNRAEKTYLVCNNCKKQLELSELRYKHETETKFNSIRKQYRGLTLDKHLSGREGTASLFMFKEGYTGRDGKQYHTCMCEEHNKFLILNDDELLYYKHEFCADTRMQAYRPKKK